MTGGTDAAWPSALCGVLRRRDVRQVAYVPDGGHAALIRLVHADETMIPVTLTTEEEGVALLAGAWLGGQRGVLLMQSSGVGNCVNMFSLARTCRLPLLTIVAMRGEWGEFNPWQVPMAAATRTCLDAMGLVVTRVDAPDDVAPAVDAAAAMAFEGGTAGAVLLSQRLIGSKVFTQ